MEKQPEACLVCGEELVYSTESRAMRCLYCGRSFPSNASCRNGHYVCDRCHAEQAVERILTAARTASSDNPMEIAVAMMKDPFVHMHGPEHHVLVGAALLAAYHNAGGRVDLDAALKELAHRGTQVPGGACGFWGCCGAAVSSGIFVSLVTGSTPMAKEAFALANRMTSAALAAIGNIGGPRCCKRDAFLSIEAALAFAKTNLGISMSFGEPYSCEFHSRNKQCIGLSCPYRAART